MLRLFYRALVKVTTFGLAGITLLGVLLVGSCAIYSTVDDARYARSYWGEKVVIDEVLASKRWHSLWRGEFGGLACTYAVVTFDAATAENLNAIGPDAILDLDWRPTPAPPERGGNFIDSFDCAGEAGGLRERVEKALAVPGSWYFLELEAAYLLSPNDRLAAKFRYGD